MRAPRRTAWASQAELGELYDMIYAPHADDHSRQKALSRMSVYLASPSCPSFIHLLHSLLSADLLPTIGAAEIQSTRLSCAMAIVRFINGMVDPLQTGPYARPISHIAASLRIPQSLISLRHRATHEDLPPLPLLKQAVRSAIEYINHYSFLPSLASSSSEPIPRSIRAENLVGRWKKLMKARSRGEVGLADSEREEKTLIREFDNEDMAEVAEALASVGGLIPLAKKKRSSLQSAEPTKASLLIWSPLIRHLASRDSQFIGSLTEQLSSIVISRIKGKKDAEKSSIRWSAAVWLLWLWSERNDLPYPDYQTKNSIRREVLAALISKDDVMSRFSEELSDIDPQFQSATTGLEDVLDDGESTEDDDNLAGLELVEEQPRRGTAEMDIDGDDMLAQMEARLARLASRKTGIVPDPSHPSTANHSHTGRPNNGWTRLDHTSWKPCPIGAWGSAPSTIIPA